MKTRKVLITWWGALEGGGETAGDIMSVIAVCNKLSELNISFDCTSLYSYDHLPNLVDWRKVDASDYDKLVFICGPVIFENTSFQELMKKFEGCEKIALGVSFVPTDDKYSHLVFDKVLSRDGLENQPNYLDLALAGCQKKTIVITNNHNSNEKRQLGICLRGAQREYGNENSLHEHVNELIDHVMDKNNFSIKIIDTRLRKDFRDPYKIYNEFSDCDLVITTRLHGSLLSLANGVPFIAIDQIKGSAKVSSQLKIINWPFVYSANVVNKEILTESINFILNNNSVINLLNDSRNIAFQSAHISLSEAIKMINAN